MKIEKVIEELQRAIDFGPGRLISVEALKVAIAVVKDAKDQGTIEGTPVKVEMLSAEVDFTRYPGDKLPEVVARRELAEDLVDQLLHSPAMQSKVTAETNNQHTLEQVTIRASVDVLVPDEEAET